MLPLVKRGAVKKHCPGNTAGAEIAGWHLFVCRVCSMYPFPGKFQDLSGGVPPMHRDHGPLDVQGRGVQGVLRTMTRGTYLGKKLDGPWQRRSHICHTTASLALGLRTCIAISAGANPRTRTRTNQRLPQQRSRPMCQIVVAR